jgi:hypothetical protein
MCLPEGHVGVKLLNAGSQGREDENEGLVRRQHDKLYKPHLRFPLHVMRCMCVCVCVCVYSVCERYVYGYR